LAFRKKALYNRLTTWHESAKPVAARRFDDKLL
jgi:hypothetical protein